ncbi:MAG: glycosyltransferase family 39 protein [Bacteroidetes bacterium]|nr:glycosyltransferase family 39 protein [Bacteroidota bacterium]
MAKKVLPKKKAQGAAAKTAIFTLPPLDGKGWLFLKDFKFQALVIVIVGVLFYANTYKNQYALDDDIIMKQNMYVQKGFSGIGEILSNDAYKSYYESMGVEQQLSGGRYRPLSVITFAIEQQIFGECYGERYTQVRDSLFDLQKKNINDQNVYRLINEKNALDKKITKVNFELARVRHNMQIYWFVLTMVVLLWLFREHFFRSNTDIAFLTVLLFTIHPIHTEVIANVKSRDEIFSLLFIGLTFIFFFQYDLKRKTKDMIWGMVCFFLALLSKEYAAVMIFLVPASLMIFHKRKLKDLTKLLFPIGAVMVLYVLVRLNAIGGAASAPVDKSSQDPLNDPYLYASREQTLASKINRLDDYLWLLILPYPLVSDYSYQHFAYSKFTDPMVWLSLAVNIGMVVLLYKLWKKKHPMAFALLLYLGFFALVCNIFFDIGATMGERLIFHSSLGFCMAIAWLLVKGLEKIKTSQPVILTCLFIAISIPAWRYTQVRNQDWKNDFSLFTKDVKVHPNSALVNGNAGSQYMDYGLSYLGHDTIIGRDTIHQFGRDTLKVYRYADTASGYLLRATQIHKKYVNGYLNLGLCYYYTNRYEQAAQAWSSAYQYFPSNNILLTYQQMFKGQANNRAARKDYAGAAKFLRCAAISVPSDAGAWADYAGASFMGKDFSNAKNGFTQAIETIGQQISNAQTAGDKQRVQDLQNQQNQLRGGLRAAMHNEICVNAWKKDSLNADSTIILANAFMGTAEFFPESKRLLNKALSIRPNDKRALFLLDSLGTLEEKLKTPTLK